jgi:orotate phosphoribosyltransferase-like protein
MIAADKRKAVYLLHQDGMSLGEIVCRLHLSRNTVHAILKQKGEMPLGPRQDKIQTEEDLLRRLYATAKDGWSVCMRS